MWCFSRNTATFALALVSAASGCSMKQLDLIDEVGGEPVEVTSQTPTVETTTEEPAPTTGNASSDEPPTEPPSSSAGVTTSSAPSTTSNSSRSEPHWSDTSRTETFEREAGASFNPCPREAPYRLGDDGPCVRCLRDDHCDYGFGCNPSLFICQRKCKTNWECINYDDAERPICDTNPQTSGLCRYCLWDYECGIGFFCRQQCYPVGPSSNP